MNAEFEQNDTNQRVAVIITDGENALIGKSPQNMRKEFSCCDLMKGHAQEGESLEDAARREAYEECGLSLTNLTRLTPPLKYSKGTTLTFFVSKMSQLPDPSSLECQSFYEYNGRQFPEIAQYLSIPLDELPTYLYKGLAKLVVDNDLVSIVKKDDENDLVLERIDDEYEDEDEEYDDFLSIEDCAELLRTQDWSEILTKDDDEIEVMVKQVNKNLTVIQINTPDPKATRKYMVNVVGPDLDIQFAVPRKTKKDGYTLGIVQDGLDEVYIVRIKKGGNHRGGRQNELAFQNYIQQQLNKDGICRMSISDDYGVTVDLDIVEVVDKSASHGQKGEANRADTTVKLSDGSYYGISHKKTNATYVCKVKKMFKQILFRCEQILREYAKQNGLQPGDYMDVRITQRDLIDLCWFGTDIATGAAFIGDFEGINTNEPHIKRIIRHGDSDVLTSFPIYVKWRILNKSYTMSLQGVCVPSLDPKWVIDDIELPGINAPLMNGRKYVTGSEDEPKRRRRKHRRRVTEDDFLTENDQLIEEARQNDMWDTVAYCAENHKMMWLKYETVDEGEIISRRVGPYSYRTRNTKIRGRSTYFYADDFTPGEERGIKCFLIENCLDVKESPKKFTPRFPIEIKQEIDRLEKQRQDDLDSKKDVDQKDRDEQIKAKNQDGVVDKDELDDCDREELKKIHANDTKTAQNIEKNRKLNDKKQQSKDKQVSVKRKPTNDADDNAVVVKDEDDVDSSNQSTENPDSKEGSIDINTQDNTVNIDASGEPSDELKDGEVQVTDADGTVLK